MNNEKIFDAIIVGGSYAGLSAALTLGRSLRQVLILDGGEPCNRYSPHSHNFLTHDGVPPADISAAGREQVLKYETVTLREDIATRGSKVGEMFEIETKKGDVLRARKLIFTTGLKDYMPQIEGFAECWGKTVVHCPYCHGYEFHGQPTGIFANGEKAYHYAPLVHNLTKDLTIFTNGKADFADEQLARLQHNNIKIEEREVSHLQHEDGILKAVVLKDGETIAVNALYLGPDFEQHCKIPEQLGCEMTKHGLIKVDEYQKTNVYGVLVAGDNAHVRSVAGAVAAGNMAGAMCNKELADEDF